MRTRSEFHQCLGTFHWGRIMLRDIWPWRMEQIFSQKYRRNIFLAVSGSQASIDLAKKQGFQFW